MIVALLWLTVGSSVFGPVQCKTDIRLIMFARLQFSMTCSIISLLFYATLNTI